MENMEQLMCEVCNGKRLVTEEEMKKYIEYRQVWNMDANDENMFEHFNRVDKKVCSGNLFHEYAWNLDFYESMLLLAQKINSSDLNLTRNKNEIVDLERRISIIEENSSKELAIIQEEFDKKMKELNDKKDKSIEELRVTIEKNKSDNEKISKETPELEQTILNRTGQNWKEWV